MNTVQRLEQLGQSVWIDNLSRDMIVSGELKELIHEKGILGLTSNPAIFEKAIKGNTSYDNAIHSLVRDGLAVRGVYEALVFQDIRDACAEFMPVYERTGGRDGYVSVEVPPDLADKTQESIDTAQRYYKEIDYPNVMIKIPGTPEGLPAVEELLQQGINVNVTLLFSIDAYEKTARTYVRALQQRASRGQDVHKVASVASFFLSRIDVMIDAMLEEKLSVLSSNEHRESSQEESTDSKAIRSLLGKAAIANAKLAYQSYLAIFSGKEWESVATIGARPQRLLWASTGTKNPSYSSTMYVDTLVGKNTVNTMPPATVEATLTSSKPLPDRVEENINSEREVFSRLGSAPINIDVDIVMNTLLEEGIDKFIKPFGVLLSSLEEKMKKISS